MIKTAAILLASGVGERFGADIPKQFLPLNGKPIIFYALETLIAHPRIDHIVVTLPNGYMTYGMELCMNLKGIEKVEFMEGGKTRQESTKFAVDSLGEDFVYVLVHDAVRPFIKSEIIDKCRDALEDYVAVDVVVPSPDTIVVKQDGTELLAYIPPRDWMRIGQTPQGFRRGWYQIAYSKITPDMKFTDDIGIMNKALGDAPIALVEGSEYNMKITTQADLFKAERIAKIIESPSVDRDWLNGKTISVFGAFGGIGKEVCKELINAGASVMPVIRENFDMFDHESIEDYCFKSEFIDGFVNCIGEFAKAESCSEDWLRLMDVNFLNPVYLASMIGRKMRKGGSAVMVGSSSAYLGRPEYTGYTAAKAALMNWVQGVALEEDWKGKRLNIVNPGRCDTPMRRKQYPNENVKDLCTAQEVAKKIVDVLCSNVTGSVFDVRANGIQA